MPLLPTNSSPDHNWILARQLLVHIQHGGASAILTRTSAGLISFFAPPDEFFSVEEKSGARFEDIAAYPRSCFAHSRFVGAFGSQAAGSRDTPWTNTACEKCSGRTSGRHEPEHSMASWREASSPACQSEWRPRQPVDWTSAWTVVLPVRRSTLRPARRRCVRLVFGLSPFFFRLLFPIEPCFEKWKL
jgi:hypothetical protein